MRGLNVCVLGPAALVITAVVIALTPMVGNAAEPSAADGDVRDVEVRKLDAATVILRIAQNRQAG
jgi:hypothetical protein